MSRTLVKLRIVLPRRSEIEAISISAGAHVVLSAAIVVAGLAWGGATELKPSRGTLMVDLVGRPELATSPPSPPKATPEPKKSTPTAEVEEKPKPRPKPKEPPPRRVEAEAPTRVEEKLEGATAQPEELPVAEEPPPAPPSSADGGESADEPSPEEGMQTEIESVGGGAGLGVETVEPFDADYYVNVVVLKLRNAWRDRPVLPQGSKPRRAVVAFRIARDGRVTEAGIAVSSGLRLLDESALRAVESVGKFPPLPRSYEKDSLGARFVFELLPPD